MPLKLGYGVAIVEFGSSDEQRQIGKAAVEFARKLNPEFAQRNWYLMPLCDSFMIGVQAVTEVRFRFRCPCGIHEGCA